MTDNEQKKRVPITKEIRQFVYERCHHICEYCFCFKVQQIHHINGNPSDSRIENLLGVCYDCHVHHLNGNGRKPKGKSFDDYETQKRLDEVKKNDQLNARPLDIHLTREQIKESMDYMDKLHIIDQWAEHNRNYGYGCSKCNNYPIVKIRYETLDTNFKRHLVRYCESCWINRYYYTNHNLINERDYLELEK